MPQEQATLPEIKGIPQFGDGARITGCSLHHECDIFISLVEGGDSEVIFCRPRSNERTHFLLGRTPTGRMSEKDLLQYSYLEPKHPK